MLQDFEPGGPYSNTALTGEGILRGAVIQYQSSKTRSEAVRKFELVAQKYPGDKEADRARLYIGMHWYWEGQNDKAMAEWQVLIAAYPESMWSEEARRELIPLALGKIKEKKETAK